MHHDVVTSFISDCEFPLRGFRLLGARRGNQRAVRTRSIRLQLRRQRSDHRWPKGSTGNEKRWRCYRLLPHRRLGRFPTHGQVQGRRRQRIHRRSPPWTGQRCRRLTSRCKGRRRDQTSRRPGGRPSRRTHPVRQPRPVRRTGNALLLRLPVQLSAVLVRLPTVPVQRRLLSVLVRSIRLQRPIRLPIRPQVNIMS